MPPQAVEVEKSVLGAMMLQPEPAVALVMSMATRKAFYTEAHRQIFDAIEALHIKKNPVDIVSVGDELRRRGQMESAGSMFYLSQLTVDVVSPAHVEYHCRIVLEKALKRQLIESTAKIISDCYDESTDAFDVLDQLKFIGAQMDGPLRQEFARSGNHEDWWKWFTNPQPVLKTGIGLLDWKIGGFQLGDNVVVMARPSGGKSAFVGNLLSNMSQSGIKTAYYGVESNNEETRTRLIANMASVENRRIFRREDLSPIEVGALEAASLDIEAKPIQFLHVPGIGISRLCGLIEKVDAQVVAVDHIQLVKGQGKTMRDQILGISRDLTAECKRKNILLMQVSQMNRNIETEKRTPRLSDLAEAGAIEQDADWVICPHDPNAVENREGNKDVVTMQLHILKGRNSGTGVVGVVFDKRYQRFADINNRAVDAPRSYYEPDRDDEPF